LPTCSHGSVRAKHGLSNPGNSVRFRHASAAPILAAADASGFAVPHKRMIDRRLHRARPIPARAQAQVKAQMAAAVLGFAV
jgi:hypothetical protein